MTTSTTSLPGGRPSMPMAWDDRPFEDLASLVRARVAAFAGRPVFTTDAGDLNLRYLAAFSDATRQTHNCHACRRFIETYGGLVVVSDDGSTEPLVWPAEAPVEYCRSVNEAREAVAGARVTGVFLSGDEAWGTGKTPDAKRDITWTHYSVANPARHRHALLSASQAAAEKLQDYGTLCRGLAEFPADVVRRALGLLETDALYRSEKTLGVAQWLLDLHERRAATKNQRARDNLTWLAVATAPAGWCHVRSTMVGTLLEDLAAGMDFEDVRKRFASKMHPLQYQRPTAPPSSGAIDQAERVFEKMGASAALARRFARVEEVEAVWRPRSTPESINDAIGGVFAALRPGAGSPRDLMSDAPAQSITWEKFARTVLPSVERMEALVPSTGNFAALVTAAEPTAPNLLKWGNPFSWYLYHGGSAASRWNLRAGSWAPVTAVCLTPAAWGGSLFPGETPGVFILLEGARDIGHTASGGLFPENLRSEYHGVRSVIEAHSRRAVVAGKDEATACGVALQAASKATWSLTIRVLSRGLWTAWRPDRWD